MKNILTEITGRIDEMPRVSNTPYQLMKIVSRENFEIRELISVVESDVSLTAQCLRIINSAAYNLSRQINSIKQAVVLLGSRSLVDIAMSLAFKDIFTTSMNGYLAEKENFWEHSVRSALAARVLAKRLHHPVNPDLAYTAGLLHDIGKAVISEFLEKHHQELSEKVGGKFMGDFLNIEQDILETDHTIVGEAMARKWQFPEAMQQAIRYHHHPENAGQPYYSLVGIVHISDVLAMLGGSGTGIDNLAYRIAQGVQLEFDLDRKIIEKIVFEIDMEYLTVMDRFNNIFGEKNE